ncbi:MAG: hypothetical protein J5722_11025 [Oscillospiraceae bacterium]|nr:hypothetical protein [Oscillospiraceae bacterium]
MRQEEIERLLQAETVSGDELGRVILENDIRRYRQQLGITDESDSAPAGPAVLEALTEKISTVEDAEALESYLALQNYIRYAQAISYAYNQQAQNGFCRLLMYMTQAQQVEHARFTLEMLPMIMTERQFREMPPPGIIARRRGVAIVADSFPCRPKCLDANDYFVEPDLDCFQEMMSLEHAAEMADKLEYFRNDLLLEGLRRQSAYNKLFALLAERLEMDGFTVFCTDVTGITEQIDEFHVQRSCLLTELTGEGEALQRKQEILDSVFRPIDLRRTEFSEEAVNRLRERLTDLSIFRNPAADPAMLLLSEG